ncbi:MAG: hypothetical protein WBG92_10675 [Thiohalocapsa sp.]
MRQLSGVYTQRFNHVCNRSGHVFQARYQAILVQKDAYLLELSRYAVLNSVRAQIVRSASDWPWSSYRAMTGEAPEWLQTRAVLAGFEETQSKAIEHYAQFVAEGQGPAQRRHCRRLSKQRVYAAGHRRSSRPALFPDQQDHSCGRLGAV